MPKEKEGETSSVVKDGNDGEVMKLKQEIKLKRDMNLHSIQPNKLMIENIQ